MKLIKIEFPKETLLGVYRITVMQRIDGDTGSDPQQADAWIPYVGTHLANDDRTRYCCPFTFVDNGVQTDVSTGVSDPAQSEPIQPGQDGNGYPTLTQFQFNNCAMSSREYIGYSTNTNTGPNEMITTTYIAINSPSISIPTILFAKMQYLNNDGGNPTSIGWRPISNGGLSNEANSRVTVSIEQVNAELSNPLKY
jgi:hypothetical protein